MKKTILFFFVVIAFVSSAQIPKPTQDTTGTDRSKSAPSTGTVIIKSTPPNCKVYYSGKELGLTPYTFKKKAGNYSFTIETEGYESQTIDVKIKKGKTSDISVSLNKKMTLLDSLLLLSKEMSQIDRMSDESNMNKEEQYL